MRNPRSLVIGFVIGIAALALDQFSKWYMLSVVDIANRPPVEVTSFFNLVMVWNRGISFGMFSGSNQPLLLIVLSSFICLILVLWLGKVTQPWVACAIGLVIGGALSNVVDRLRFGAVADFFDFYIQNTHWPAFNMADSFIFIGVVLLCIDSMFMQKNKPDRT